MVLSGKRSWTPLIAVPLGIAVGGAFLLGGRGDGEVKVPFLGRRWCGEGVKKVRGRGGRFSSGF